MKGGEWNMENQAQPGTAQQTPAPAQAPATPAPVAQPAPAVPAQPLPESASDRTRTQFEKLLESNQRLYQTNELLRQELQQRREVGQTLTQPQKAQPAQPNNSNDFTIVNPETGEKYIDEVKLKNRIDELTRATQQAKEQADYIAKTAQDREIDRQNKEAFTTYPELEPGNDKFNPGFHQIVRGVLYDSMVNLEKNYGGRALTFKEAADFVRAQMNPGQTVTAAQAAQVQAAASEAAANTATAEKDKASEASRDAKQQVSAQVQSQPNAQRSVVEDEELANLRYRTRYYNGDTALAERIKHTEHILPKDATVV